MLIRIENFDYQGQHYDHCEFNLPQVRNVDDLGSSVLEYIKESLDTFRKIKGES